MNATTALGLRMTSLLLRGDGPGSVAGIVEWFGAMQAQDVNSGLWSFGVRLPGFALADVEAALERREAIRTWPMRGTVHFVPPADAHWMLDLMGSRALAGAAKRRETLGLSQADADRAVDVLGGVLAGGGRLTRAECLAALGDAGIEVTGQRGYHLLWYASQRAVTAIAPHIGKEQTFVLLDEWVPEPHRPTRDEALALIAVRYFRGHGPATRKDFAGWTGLTMGDCKAGIAGAGDALSTVDVEGVEMIAATAVLDGDTPPVPAGSSLHDRAVPLPAGSSLHDPAVPLPAGSSAAAATAARSAAATSPAGATADPADVAAAARPAAAGGDDWLALPGFDEYLLGYKDRSLMASPDDLAAVIPGGNGVFQSTIVRSGRVVATWKRALTAKGVTVTVHPLAAFTAADHRAVAAALEPYASYLGLPLTVKNP